jgi:hypothetical protein
LLTPCRFAERGEIAYIAAPIALDRVLARLQREIRSNETPVVVGLTSP